MIVNMGNNRLNNPNVLPTCMCSGMDNPGGTSLILGQTILSYLTACKLLWIPNGTGAVDSTEPDLSGNNNTLTYKGTHAMGTQGFARKDTFDGTSAYGTIADSDTLSFGNGTNDSAMSIGAWVNVTDTANDKQIVSKYHRTGTTAREWQFKLTNTELFNFSITDESAVKTAQKQIDAAVSVGWKFFAVTYDGTGGSNALTGANCVLYVNAATPAATAYNDALYVAMENTAALPLIGASRQSATLYEYFWPSGMACVFVTGEELSAATILNMYNSTRGYIGV